MIVVGLLLAVVVFVVVLGVGSGLSGLLRDDDDEPRERLFGDNVTAVMVAAGAAFAVLVLVVALLFGVRGIAGDN